MQGKILEKERQKTRQTGRRQGREGKWDRRGEKYFDRRNDEGKEGSESRCDRRKVGNMGDYSKKVVKRKIKERNNREGSRAGYSSAR